MSAAIREPVMSLGPTPGGEMAAATATAARTAFPGGNRCLDLRDALGPITNDGQFSALFAASGRPAKCPWRLVLVTLLQFGPGSLGPPRGPVPCAGASTGSTCSGWSSSIPASTPGC